MLNWQLEIKKKSISFRTFLSYKKYFSENLMAIEMKKKVKMNKPICLGMSILDISKTLMYEFWCDYIKQKYQNRAKRCYMDTDSFVIQIIIEYFYKKIANDIEKWFGTSNHDEDDKRPLPLGKSKIVIGLFKDKSGGKVMIELAGLGAKVYAYIMNDDTEHKKARDKKVCNKRRTYV